MLKTSEKVNSRESDYVTIYFIMMLVQIENRLRISLAEITGMISMKHVHIIDICSRIEINTQANFGDHVTGLFVTWFIKRAARKTTNLACVHGMLP